MELIQLLMMYAVCLTTFTIRHIHNQYRGYNFETREGCIYDVAPIWKEARND